MSENFFVGVGAVDWFRATTFNHDLASAWYVVVDELAHKKTSESRALGYVGFRGPGVFVGEAVQKGKTHYMGEFHGGAAKDWAYFQGGRATRIDLQITIPLVLGSYDAVGYAAGLRAASWAIRGGRPSVTVIQGEGGWDTVYLGNRQSERFVRIYAKGDTRPEYLRFEVEYKSSMAREVQSRLMRGVSAASILASEALRVPDVDKMTTAFLSFLGGPSEPVRRVRKDSNSVRWVQKQVLPGLRRLLNDHDDGARIRTWLTELLDE